MATKSDADANSTTAGVASIRARAVAYVIDVLLVGGVVTGLSGRKRTLGATVTSLLGRATVAGTLYHVLLEGSTGRTVGKAVAGIAVVRTDGSACTYRGAAVRTALRVVDALPVAYLVGLVTCVLTGRRQRLGDVLAATVVVRSRGDGSGRPTIGGG